MFARVIPPLRTPLGVDAFDYRIPEGMTVTQGDLVLVPFRRQTLPALVADTQKTSPFANRALEIKDSYGGLRFPKSFVDFVQWTSRRTFCSPPTVLDAFLRKLPKKPGKLSPIISSEISQLGSMESYWEAKASHRLIKQAEEVRNQGRVLILTPWKHRATRLASELKAAYLTGDLADGAAFKAWHGFVSNPTGILIATRLGGWLSPLSDFVLIDEPAADDHKQDDLAPRYDARRLAAWAATHAGTRVEAYGVTAPLHVSEMSPDIKIDLTVTPRSRAGWSKIPMLEASALESLREHAGPRIIIHPIRGEAARFSCRDCGWTAVCEHCQFPISPTSQGALCRRCGRRNETPLTCAKCGGTDLGKSLPGIDRLKRAWSTHEPELAVDWRGIAPAEIDQPIPKNSMVLVTDGALLAIGGTEDIRRRERTAIAFRWLADAVAKADGRLLIQSTDASYDDWEAWLGSESYELFKKNELRERRLFEYPPSVRLYKAIMPTLDAEPWGLAAETALDGIARLRGPFSISNRPSSRGARSLWHILPQVNVSEEILLEKLRPLVKAGVILDLDPIAFFR